MKIITPKRYLIFSIIINVLFVAAFVSLFEIPRSMYPSILQWLHRWVPLLTLLLFIVILASFFHGLFRLRKDADTTQKKHLTCGVVINALILCLTILFLLSLLLFLPSPVPA